MMVVLSCSQQSIPAPFRTIIEDQASSIPPAAKISDRRLVSRRRTTLLRLGLAPCVLTSLIGSFGVGRHRDTLAFAVDEVGAEENRVINIFQESSQSVVFIKDLELPKDQSPSSASNNVMVGEDEYATVSGTGSGFIWDKFGYIVTN